MFPPVNAGIKCNSVHMFKIMSFVDMGVSVVKVVAFVYSCIVFKIIMVANQLSV